MKKMEKDWEQYVLPQLYYIEFSDQFYELLKLNESNLKNEW